MKSISDCAKRYAISLQNLKNELVLSVIRGGEVGKVKYHEIKFKMTKSTIIISYIFLRTNKWINARNMMASIQDIARRGY